MKNLQVRRRMHQRDHTPRLRAERADKTVCQEDGCSSIDDTKWLGAFSRSVAVASVKRASIRTAMAGLNEAQMLYLVHLRALISMLTKVY